MTPLKQEFKTIDDKIYKDRQENHQYFHSIDDLDLSHYQKIQVLEWFARKLWTLLEEGSGDPDYYCKSYDPLLIEGNTAHSYVFDLEDGGRHHQFKDLEHLESMLMDEGISSIKQMIASMVTIQAQEL